MTEPVSQVTQHPDDDEAIADGDDFGNLEVEPRELTCVVAPDLAGERLDKALASLSGLSRSRLQALITESGVFEEGKAVADSARRVRAGDVFVVVIPAAVPAAPEPENIPLAVVFEDDDLLVIDKPAGMVVHPAAGNPTGTLVNALLAHCGGSLSGIGGVRRPGIVHRLDKDTSGLIVVAKNDQAHRGLTAQFADRTLSRTYQAVVWGLPSPGTGRIEGNIGRSAADRKRMAVVASGGKAAATRYRVAQSFGRSAALVECTLETGRTHQIRVHMAHAGHPLIGDPLYGHGRAGRPSGANAAALPAHVRSALLDFPRQALHAAALTFVHPSTGETLRFAAGMPPDLEALVALLRRG